MNINCYRCDSKLEDVTPDEVEEIKFWSCTSCHCGYTENKEGRLHDRWMMPITLPLYSVIFEEDPLVKVGLVVAQMSRKKKDFLDILIEHISSELETPKQRLTDIHDFRYPNEELLREFLSQVKLGIEEKLSDDL